MKYTIDFDWNQVFVYDENNQIVFQETALCLYDLRTEKLVAVGEEAKNKLPENKNWLSVVFIENKKLLSKKDLFIFLDYLTKKYQLKNWNVVNRYGWNQKDFAFELLDEIDFIHRFTDKGIYLDIRNNETLIYHFQEKKLIVIQQGIIKVLNYLARYFYLNFAATLNTKKLFKLLDDLPTSDVNVVNCRSYQTGKDVEIKINKNQLLQEIFDFNQLIKSKYPKTQEIYKTLNYQKVFWFDD